MQNFLSLPQKNCNIALDYGYNTKQRRAYLTESKHYPIELSITLPGSLTRRSLFLRAPKTTPLGAPLFSPAIPPCITYHQCVHHARYPVLVMK